MIKKYGTIIAQMREIRAQFYSNIEK